MRFLRISGGCLLLIVLVLSGAIAAEPQLGKPITVAGTAQNAKLGAIVLTDSQSVYYLKGKDSWEPELLNKKVRVSGTLEQFELSQAVKKNGEWTAGVTEPGSAYRIENFKLEP